MLTRFFEPKDLAKLQQGRGSARKYVKIQSSHCHKPKRYGWGGGVYGCSRSGVAETLAKKSICSEGRHTKDFSSILNSVPETLPRMLKKHAAKDGAPPATKRTQSERLSGILSLSLFLVRRRVSMETHAFFHLNKKAVFRPVASRRCPTSGFGNRMTFSNNPEKLDQLAGRRLQRKCNF